MHEMKKSYGKMFVCFVLALFLVISQTVAGIAAAECGIDDIVDGFTPPKNTTIIHYLNTAEKPYTKIANAVSELWVGDHHRFTVVANKRENVKVRWYSSDPEVASINKSTGELTALSAGTATITMWDRVNKAKRKTTLTVKAVPVLPEIPREWYTIGEKPDWCREDGIQLVLKSAYRYLYEQCSMLQIPESVDGQKIVWISTEDNLKFRDYDMYRLGFEQLKILQCSASYMPSVRYVDELIYPEGTQLIDDNVGSKRIHVPESVKLLTCEGLGSEGLEEVRLPASVKFFCCNFNPDYYHYYGITHGENVRFVVDGNNTNYYSIADVLFSYPYYSPNYDEEKYWSKNWLRISATDYEMLANKNALLAYPEKKTGAVYYVPDGVERIEDCAFYGASYLTKIVLPDSVTEIGEGAFAKMQNKVEIVIPASVTEIELPYSPYMDYDYANMGNITFITPKGSTAEAYAIENGIAYRNE